MMGIMGCRLRICVNRGHAPSRCIFAHSISRFISFPNILLRSPPGQLAVRPNISSAVIINTGPSASYVLKKLGILILRFSSDRPKDVGTVPTPAQRRMLSHLINSSTSPST